MEEYEMTCSECGRRFRVQVTTMNVPGGKEREDIYDCARHYWRLSVNRAEKAEYVLAIVHGIVKAVFKPIRWYRSETFIGKSVRYEFDGVMVEYSPFIGLCVWNCVNSKSQNPVAYINI